MFSFSAVIPGFPAIVPRNTPCLWAPFAAVNPVGQVPPPFIPMFNLQQERKKRRLFLLQMSVFDMVVAYNQMALTDPRLLKWYLCLSPDDKNIINEEGGLYHFLRRHPGLEVNQGPRFEKYVLKHRALPVQTSKEHVYVSQSGAAASQTYACDHWAYMGHANTGTARGKAYLSCDDVTMLRPATYDATVTACSSVHTQTEAPETAERHTSVQSYAGDADCLAEDFVKLEMSQEHEEPEEGKRTFQDPRKREEAERCADDTSRNSCQNEMQKKQMAATCGEVGDTEIWYDAEEELQHSQAADVRHDTDCGDESSGDEVINSGPPSIVTQSEVVHLFEKSQPSEVTPSASNNDLSVPTAVVNYLQSDEVAELTCSQVHGRPLHEEFLSSRFKRSPVAAAPEPPSTDLSSSEGKLVAPPPLSSRIRTKQVVCITPTANQTFVPQHFSTLGSFNTLTDELVQRHPDVSRQRIVDTLMELWAQHRGVLYSLPLETIRDMTSELLTRLAVTTEP